ncbi:hypothetical protein [Methylicorpusculum sp.]|uniref:hypothetical protein n=1 Tax=Methylicorpusculum sp. TaxID=2713644 RepID=UPI0027225C99|nr:hypothetical protein [Methylicorpusculum sp.]MDO8842863.1 hypothetical protein [Methylicorpusculum sp.]MDP3528289.1 hypothetical protein [Methylicorpusculum sp.]MDZ4153815.1 hypothetical protein [Methylicorpusculum sp.]
MFLIQKGNTPKIVAVQVVGKQRQRQGLTRKRGVIVKQLPNKIKQYRYSMKRHPAK